MEPDSAVLGGRSDTRWNDRPTRAHSSALERDDGRVALEARTLPDLLMYYLVYVMEGSKVAALAEIDHQLLDLRVRLHDRAHRAADV